MAEEPVGPDTHSHFLPVPHPTPGPGKHRLRVSNKCHSERFLLARCYPKRLQVHFIL